MMIKSFLTGGRPRERVKDIELEDHLECECGCNSGDCASKEDVIRDNQSDLIACNQNGSGRHIIDLIIGLILGKVNLVENIKH